MAGPFRIEGKTCTIVAESRPAEYDESRYGTVIIIIGIIAFAAAGMAIYKKNAKA